MSASISFISTKQLLTQFSSSPQKNIDETTSDMQIANSKPLSQSLLNEMRAANRVSSINQQEVKKFYSEIKTAAAAELEANNFEHKALKTYDYLNSTIEEIMTAPIDVKIARDEINTAILYNSLGISFLDVKRIEVRMEILNLAQEDVTKAGNVGDIRKDQEKYLTTKIADYSNELQQQKQVLLERISKLMRPH